MLIDRPPVEFDDIACRFAVFPRNLDCCRVGIDAGPHCWFTCMWHVHIFHLKVWIIIIGSFNVFYRQTLIVRLGNALLIYLISRLQAVQNALQSHLALCPGLQVLNEMVPCYPRQ